MIKRIHTNSLIKTTCNSGFTLVELLIVLVLSAIIMTVVYAAYTMQKRTYTAQTDVSETQQNARAGLDLFVREIRMAGYDKLTTANAGITTATATTFAFTADLNENGSVLAGPTNPDENVSLSIDPVANALTRNTGGGAQPIANNITNLEFFYTMDDGTQTLAPAQLDQIATVTISILATSPQSTPGLTAPVNYTSASLVDWTGTAQTDGFRRRFYSMEVTCRN